jgi:hypothetical protein
MPICGLPARARQAALAPGDWNLAPRRPAPYEPGGRGFEPALELSQAELTYTPEVEWRLSNGQESTHPAALRGRGEPGVPSDFERNLRLFEAMYQHARALGAWDQGPDTLPVKLRLARALNV